MIDSISDFRSACARVLTEEGVFLGTAFLISGQRALTAAHNLKDNQRVILEFPLGRYEARLETADSTLDCAILFCTSAVEDVRPLELGFDVALGDIGHFYGYPKDLGTVGIFFEGHVQDTTAPLGPIKRPSILLFPSHAISPKLYTGVSGSPLIVSGKVVGILTKLHSNASEFVNFLAFTKIQDALNLLPEEVVVRMRPGHAQKAEPGHQATPKAAVITALDEELDYLYELPLDWTAPIVHKDGTTYRRGHLSNGIDIIATSARSMGLTAMAVVTAKTLKEWNPTIAAMIGVCGGRKEKGLNIGDIVVANQCFHYQFGAFENGRVIRELRMESPEPQVLDLAEHLARRTQLLSEVQNALQRGFKAPDTVLKCHFGPIASADLVVKDVKKLGEAIQADRKTIAVDMESYAFMRAARLAGTRLAFVVKSVSDFADAQKTDDYREYAKYTSTSFSFQVIRYLLEGIADVSA